MPSSEPLRSRRFDSPHRPADHAHDEHTLLAAMLDATDEQTAVSDSHGCLLAANAAWRRHDGQALAPVREARWIRRGVRAVWQGRVSLYEQTYPADGPGGLHWFRLRARQHADRHGHLTILTRTDVTDQRRARDELRQARSRKPVPNPAADKMAALVRMAGGVAHEFNNLLTIITGFGHLALNLDPPAHLRDCLEKICRAGESAAYLTHRLNVLGRRSNGKTIRLNAADFLAEFEPAIHQAAGPDIAVEVRLAAHLPAVSVELAQLQHALLNLVTNAREAMPAGGRLEVRADRYPLASPAAAALAAEPGEYVRFAVRDTGRGMAPEVQAHLFEPFFTSKPKGRNLGLGLATVYAIVRRQGGVVRVASAPGAGTVVEILLPAG